MKKHLLAFGAVLALAGCSSDSGGNKNINLDPMAKPSNPASKEYVADVIRSLQNSKTVIPDDEAIFSTVLDGDDVKYVTPSEQAEAGKKLDINGRQFAEDIKKNCSLKGAKKTESGGSVAKGATITSKSTLSSSGANCGWLIDQSTSNSTYYNDISGDQFGNSGRVSATMTREQRNRREIRDPKVVAKSGLQLMDMLLTMDMNMNAVMASGKQSMTMNGRIGGSVKLKLANGDEISGPIVGTMDVNSDSFDSRGKTNATIRFNGTSRGGDIWFTIVMKNGQQELYLNGEKINADGLNFGKTMEMLDTAL
jgi:hypothetical protein